MRSKPDSLSAQHVADVFRDLANEHAREREPFDKRRAWQFVQRTQRALTGVGVPRPSGWLTRLRFAAALSVLAVALVFGVRAWQSWSVLRYEARGLLREGNILSARQAPATLDFSDGSRVEVSPNSSFNLDIVGRRAALTRLAKGRLHVSVHHEPDTDWHFFAGPYEVQVVGTEFDLGWDGNAEGLTLAMKSGEVRVLGDVRVHRVVGGQTLHLPPIVVAPVPSQPLPVAPESVSPSALSARLPSARGAEPTAHAPRVAAPDWGALLDQGHFADVVQGADALGLDAALSSSSARDLKALALSARYTGRRTLSLRAWSALRERFPTAAIGSGAAFFLGRGYEEQGDAGEALRWLGRYLSEAPSGVYAGEALGRKLLLLDRVGDHSAAQAGARDYLNRYPRGAYVKSALSIVQSD